MRGKKAIGVLAILVGLAVCTQSGCAVNHSQSDDMQSGQNVQIANPWRDITEAEAKELCPHSFGVPAGAENVVWSAMDADSDGVPGALVQLSFDLNGDSFTAREQVTGDKEADISGMYYEWTQQDDITLVNGADSQMKGKYYRYIGEDEWADLCTWYDKEAGISYSVSVSSKDLDGFDLQAIAEALYVPEN